MSLGSFSKATLQVGIFIVSSQVHAAFERDSYRDIRLLGRGNAAIADVTGGAAAFYNPAGLADTSTFSFIPLDFTLGGNKNVVTSISSVTSLTSSDETLSQKFSPLLGKPLALQGTFFPHVAVPHFMIGFYDYADINIEYRDPVFPRLDLQARNDWGLILGGGLNITPQIQVGASVRYMKRKGFDEVLNMATVLNLTGAYLLEIMEEGEAFGFNLGTRYTQRIGKSSWIAGGVVVEDYGGTKFRNADRGPLPETQAQKFNVGLGYGFLIPKGELKFLFDVKELGDSEKSSTKKIFMGTELNVPFVNLRLGLFQGYWTAGLTTSIIPFFDLDVATYGEELASAAGLREARYWMIGFRTGLDMKKGTKKKQRYTLDGL